VLIDDNNVTIAGHPQDYMPGYDLSRTLSGYGLTTETTMGEDLDALYIDLCRAFKDANPHALIIKRPMAPGIPDVEGSPHAHEVIKAETAIKYLEKRGGYESAIELLKAAKPDKSPLTFKGSSGVGKNRDDFGKIINEHCWRMSESERLASVGCSITIWKGPAACTTFARRTRRCSCAAASWSAATSPRPRDSAPPTASKAFSRRSAPSSKCASAKSPWRASTSPMCWPISATAASTTWRTTPATSASTACSPTAA
jgi:hypothetical protein